MFDLKDYQRRVLARLDEFLRQARIYGAAKSYDEVAKREDENGNKENPYASTVYKQTISGLDDCPHVCLRIPTGGGKTYLAARSVALADNYMETQKRPTVLWLAPSNTIRTQTEQMLKDRKHPCRIALEDYFGYDIVVRNIADFDASRAQDFDSSVCIIVSTAQMFAVNETAKEGDDGMTEATRRIYASHELLQPHFERFLPSPPPESLERDEKGNVKYSFVNLLHLRRPLVILDEAHNFLSDLSQEVLRRINPKCILEWTATPRKDKSGEPLHNVLVSIPAADLQAEEMLKLPVWLTEHRGWENAVNGAIIERDKLAKAAKESGDIVRPVVLYKAQSNTGTNPITPEVLKQHLIDNEGIDESAIATVTSKTKDLQNVDVLAPDCPIKHIITIEALREGWDCPYAYVLCSVVDIHSDIAVEQLMGRVMRMPFAKRRNNKMLNRAYAHMPVDIAREAVETMCRKMAKRLGFDEDNEAAQVIQPSFSPDYQGDDDGGLLDEANRTFQLASAPVFDNLPPESQQIANIGVETHINKETGDCKVIVKKPINDDVVGAIVDAMPEEKRPREKRRLQYINRQLAKPLSPARRGIAFGNLPQLCFYSPEEETSVIADADSLHTATNWNIIGDDCLIENFFITETADVFEIDIGGNKLVIRKQGSFDLPPDAGGGAEDQKRLIGWLERQLRYPDGRYTPDTLRRFVNININALTAQNHTLPQLARAKYQFAEALKQRLLAHDEQAQQQTASKYLFDNAKVECRFSFDFPAERYYTPARPYRGRYDFRRHFYGNVGDFDSEEERQCAIALDENDNVRHWVRNIPKPDYYRIPLASGKNFYPDFVAELTSGELLVVEYKGKHLAGADNHKTQAGKFLEDKAGGKCFFVVITEKPGSPAAETQIKAKIQQIREKNTQ